VHRYGNLLTIVFIINDPAYLTAPYIRESSWIFDPTQIIPPFPCEITPDGTIVPAGKVPSFFPGKNDVLTEFATEYGIPLEGALGGEETLYPEYIKKMKTMKVAPETREVLGCRSLRARGRVWIHQQCDPIQSERADEFFCQQRDEHDGKSRWTARRRRHLPAVGNGRRRRRAHVARLCQRRARSG
jgi:hypothetical protein